MTTDRASRYLQRAVDRCLDAVRSAGEGGRRDTVNREAFALGGLLHHGLSRSDVEAALVAAAESTGLPRTEAAATVRKALDDGSRNRRALPDGIERGRNGRPVTIGEAHPLPKPKPPELAPPESVRGVLRDVWGDGPGEDAPAPALEAWCGARRIDVALARRLGCIDASWLVSRIVGAGKGVADAVAAAGLARPPKDKGKPWSVFGRYSAPGVVVPVWSPVWPDAPVAYRWRQSTKKPAWPDAPKEVASFGAGVWSQWPLGVRSLEDANPLAPVVVVEGVPDWLTVTAACVPDGAPVLGAPGQWWPQHAEDLVRGRPLVVATHDEGNAATKAEKAVFDAGAVKAWCRPAGDRDWNDRWMDAPPWGVLGWREDGLAPLRECVRGIVREAGGSEEEEGAVRARRSLYAAGWRNGKWTTDAARERYEAAARRRSDALREAGEW